jgi:hypothetical protein
MFHSHRNLHHLILGSALAAVSVGCLDRPVAPAKPRTTNVFVETVEQGSVDKIDLLFMIDNSLSMKDKQNILEEAVPVLVKRLVSPRCLDREGNPVGMVDSAGTCATGRPEFHPINDIHLGLITSSLGGHGGDECQVRADDATTGRTPDDRAELLPKVRPNAALASWNQTGFLAWDPGQKQTPPGEASVDTFVANFAHQVEATGEIGCGYESSLEAWYRFLVDPEPPTNIAKVNGPNGPVNSKGAVNEALLAQRAAFLRPDSLLAVVMLTDENDCSIDDEEGHQGFFVTANGAMMRSSAACAANPNDRCCHTCALPAPEGCPANEADTECSKGSSVEAQNDHKNLRCFHQKQRFGIDLLYPTSRYVDGLTKRTVRNRANQEVQNPIFAVKDGKAPRDPGHVLLAGIIGVPWQDIATTQSLEGNGLSYMTATELTAQGRWDVILGDPQKNVLPLDPHMHESITPRSGVNPVLEVPLAPPTSANTDPISGHEQNVPKLDDLQYACTFTLPDPHQCNPSNELTCECNVGERANNRSLCTYPADPNAEGTQVAAKAYPGTRHLEVLRGIGQAGVVASICPKNTAPAGGVLPENDPSYGYNPAVASLITAIGARLVQCLPRALKPETDPDSESFGQVACKAVEATPSLGNACTCDTAKGRSPIDSATVRQSVRTELETSALCGGDTHVDCNSYCLCEINQLKGGELSACQAGTEASNVYGYCYVDEDQHIGDPALVEQCPDTQKRLLRFAGDGVPAPGSTLVMACLGEAL